MEERVAHYADIDTRRAMGFPPRRLQIDRDQVLFLRGPHGFESFKYYPNRNVVIYFSRLDNYHFNMEVTTNVMWGDPQDGWITIPETISESRDYRLNNYFLHYAGHPETVQEAPSEEAE